jgi:hypothetical protein
VNGNENAFARNVPLSVEVYNAVCNYMAFAEERMAGAWTSESSLAAARQEKANEKSAVREGAGPANVEDIIERTVSRCW